MKTLFNNLFYILVGLLTGGVVWLISIPPRGEPVTLVSPPTPGPLVVHVAGWVSAPGVYELPQGARVRDAVTAAGGVLPEGNLDAVNLAAKLEDGQQIRVLGKSESGQTETNPGTININTASLAQLQSLPGIGPTIAQRIIAHREQNGAFTDTIDITKVSGIGPSTYEKIKDRITTDH